MRPIPVRSRLKRNFQRRQRDRRNRTKMKTRVPRPRPSAGKNKNCKVGDGWASNSISSTALFLLPKRTTGIDHASLCQPEHNLNYLAGGEPVWLGSGDYFPKVVSSWPALWVENRRAFCIRPKARKHTGTTDVRYQWLVNRGSRMTER